MLFLNVQDDGVGFSVKETAEPGLGLLGIEERVRELGGRVSIVSQPQKGTLLKAELPCTRKVSA
jgi:signal transduction histidine kinase